MKEQREPFKMNLQLFGNDPMTLAGLDSLLDGNTTDPAPVPNTDTQPTDTQPTETNVGGDDLGGDPHLEPPVTDTTEDGQPQATDGGDKGNAAMNAAFAKLRTENTQYTKTLKQLAEALGIDENDPTKLSNALVDMAQNKLAQQANIPKEFYSKFVATQEQLEVLQQHQNQEIARNKFGAVKEAYGLDDKELIAFATQLDKDGVYVAQNPDIDIEYEYYKRNREKIEAARVQAAVEKALADANTAQQHSSKPTPITGGNKDTPDKINNVSALNALLDGK